MDKKYNTTHVAMRRVSGDFHFEASGASPVAVHLDASESIGGTNLGARPMELLLMGLGGCSVIDIVLILKKARQQVDDIKISIEGQREADKEPSPFEKIHVHFEIKGEVTQKRADDAARLSMEKYCSAAAMLSQSAQITWSVSILAL